MRACRRAVEVRGDDVEHHVGHEIPGGDVPFELLAEGCPHRALGAEEVGGREMAEAEAGGRTACPSRHPARPGQMSRAATLPPGSPPCWSRPSFDGVTFEPFFALSVIAVALINVSLELAV